MARTVEHAFLACTCKREVVAVCIIVQYTHFFGIQQLCRVLLQSHGCHKRSDQVAFLLARTSPPQPQLACDCSWNCIVLAGHFLFWRKHVQDWYHALQSICLPHSGISQGPLHMHAEVCLVSISSISSECHAQSLQHATHHGLHQHRSRRCQPCCADLQLHSIALPEQQARCCLQR